MTLENTEARRSILFPLKLNLESHDIENMNNNCFTTFLLIVGDMKLTSNHAFDNKEQEETAPRY